MNQHLIFNENIKSYDLNNINIFSIFFNVWQRIPLELKSQFPLTRI
jgi:hypothetical protein